MTTRYRTLGIIFRVRDRSEADRIFSVFTKQTGRIELFAKAIRKMNSKLRGGAELFSVAELEFIEGRTKKTLTDATSITRFSAIKKSPEKFAVAHAMSRIIDEFIKGQEIDEHIFAFLHEIFGNLDAVPVHTIKLLYMYFFWNFMAVLGYHPQLASCAHCHNALMPNGLHFSPAEGGIVCPACAREKKSIVSISAEVVKVLRIILSQQWDVLVKLRMNKHLEQALAEISKVYYRYLLATHGKIQSEQ